MNYLKLLENKVLKNETLKIELDINIYTKSTILKSTYKFTDRAYIYIEKDKDIKKHIIYFTPKDIISLDILSGEFINELLDQELRSVVLKETSKIRNVIVTRALLSGQSNE